MTTLSRVWDETILFMRREAHLLAPLALATLFLGSVLGALGEDRMGGTGSPLAGNMLTFAATLWSITGQLAIMTLTLHPGQSVGESLTQATRRLPKVMLLGITAGAVMIALLIPLAFALNAAGIDAGALRSIEGLPGWALLWLLGLCAALIWILARLAPINALIMDANPPLFTAFSQAFSMTRGIASRLLIALFIYGLVTLVTTIAVRFVFGSLFVLLGKMLGSPFLSQVLFALTSGLLTTALTATAAVFVAILYRELRQGI